MRVHLLSLLLAATILHARRQGVEDEWGTAYCRARYCGVMPASRWAHCCTHHQHCCAYAELLQDKEPSSNATQQTPELPHRFQSPSERSSKGMSHDQPLQLKPPPTPDAHPTLPKPQALQQGPQPLSTSAQSTSSHPQPSSTSVQSTSIHPQPSSSSDQSLPSHSKSQPLSDQPQDGTASPHSSHEYSPGLVQWGTQFCRARYCGVMAEGRWQYCCHQHHACCAYVTLAKAQDMNRGLQISEGRQASHRFRESRHKPPAPPAPPADAPSTPVAGPPARNATGAGYRPPFRNQRQVSFYNDVYLVDGDKWGRQYCKASYCSIMPSVKWQHCCFEYRQCCAYVKYTAPRDMTGPFAYEEISIFSVPLKPPRTLPFGQPQRLPLTTTAPTTPTTTPTPRDQPDGRRGNDVVGSDVVGESGVLGKGEGKYRSEVEYDLRKAGSGPEVITLGKGSRLSYNEVIAKQEAQQCRPRFCGLLSRAKWETCCVRYKQCCAYVNYMENRGPFYFEENPKKFHKRHDVHHN